MENTEPNDLSVVCPRTEESPNCTDIVGSPKYSTDGLCSQVVHYYFTLEKDTTSDAEPIYEKVWWKRTVRNVRQEDESTTRSGKTFRPLNILDEKVRLSPESVKRLIGDTEGLVSKSTECISSDR